MFVTGIFELLQIKKQRTFNPVLWKTDGFVTIWRSLCWIGTGSNNSNTCSSPKACTLQLQLSVSNSPGYTTLQSFLPWYTPKMYVNVNVIHTGASPLLLTKGCSACIHFMCDTEVIALMQDKFLSHLCVFFEISWWQPDNFQAQVLSCLWLTEEALQKDLF